MSQCICEPSTIHFQNAHKGYWAGCVHQGATLPFMQQHLRNAWGTKGNSPLLHMQTTMSQSKNAPGNRTWKLRYAKEAHFMSTSKLGSCRVYRTNWKHAKCTCKYDGTSTVADVASVKTNVLLKWRGREKNIAVEKAVSARVTTQKRPQMEFMVTSFLMWFPLLWSPLLIAVVS